MPNVCQRWGKGGALRVASKVNISLDLFFRLFFTDCTMVNHHEKPTILEKMFGTFSKHQTFANPSQRYLLWGLDFQFGFGVLCS